MRQQNFKITKTERNCLVVERLSKWVIKAGAFTIIFGGAWLLGAAAVREFTMNNKNYEQ